MINATDNEDLAKELWGDKRHWDDEAGQWMPDDGKYAGPSREVDASAGTSSSPSPTTPDRSSEMNRSSGSSPAPTTESRTHEDPTGNSSAGSTATSQKAPGRKTSR